MRLYWLIEPEISSSATIGGGLVFGPMKRRSMKSPPPFMLARKVRRMSIRWPRAMRRRAAACAPRQSGSTSRFIASLAAAISAARHLREILVLQHFAVRHRHARVELDLALLLAACRPAPENSASCTRVAPACGASRRPPAPAAASCRSADRYSRGGGRRCGTPDRTAPNARGASRTPHAASSKNRRGCRRRRPSPLRAHRAPRRARPECRRRAARGRNRRCSRRAGRAVFVGHWVGHDGTILALLRREASCRKRCANVPRRHAVSVHVSQRGRSRSGCETHRIADFRTELRCGRYCQIPVLDCRPDSAACPGRPRSACCCFSLPALPTAY